MEMRYGPDNCQRLQLSDSIIFLSNTQGSAAIGDWVHVTIILVLSQHGSNAMDRGVSLQHKITLEIGVGQHWRSDQLPFEHLKRGLTIW